MIVKDSLGLCSELEREMNKYRVRVEKQFDDVPHAVANGNQIQQVLMNLLINAPFITVAEAADLGVRRISVGGTLARTAWGGFLEAAKELADTGTVSRFVGLPNVDALFG